MKPSTDHVTRDLESPARLGRREGAPWRHLASTFGRMSRKGVIGSSLALVDQAVVSLASFLTTIIVGRVCGTEELGLYALAISIAFFFVAVQDTLVSMPYTVFGNRLKGHVRRQYAGSVLAHCVLLAAMATAGLSLLGALLSAGIGPSPLAPILWALVGMIACDLLRHFVRRFSFAHHRVMSAFLLDLAVTAIQIGGLLVLAFSGALSAAGALSMIAVACAVSGLGWMMRNRHGFAVLPRAVEEDFRRNWKIGKWLLASRLLVYIYDYAPYWVLVLMINTTATGVIGACKTIILFSNLLLLGVGNMLGARAALAFANGGPAAVRGVICRTMLFLVATMAGFCTIVILFSTEIAQALYGDNDYAGYGSVMVLLAFDALIDSIFFVVDPGLVAIERPDVSLKTNLLGFGMSIPLAGVMVANWGIFGMALALLIGNVASTGVQTVVFFRLVGDPPQQGTTTLNA